MLNNINSICYKKNKSSGLYINMKSIDLFLSKIIISPVPFRASSILHWGFVAGVPSQPGECWGIKAARELAGRCLESPTMTKKKNRDLFVFSKEKKKKHERIL